MSSCWLKMSLRCSDTSFRSSRTAILSLDIVGCLKGYRQNDMHGLWGSLVLDITTDRCHPFAAIVNTVSFFDGHIWIKTFTGNFCNMDDEVITGSDIYLHSICS